MELETVQAERGTFAVNKPIALVEAAREFETLLISRLLKAARESAKLETSEDSDPAAESYRELAEQNVARALSETEAFGLARMLVAEMER